MKTIHLVAPNEIRTHRIGIDDTIDTPGGKLLAHQWDQHCLTEAAKTYMTKSKHFTNWYQHTFLKHLNNPTSIKCPTHK